MSNLVTNRRTVLRAAASASGLLATGAVMSACGGSSDAGGSESTTTAPTTAPASGGSSATAAGSDAASATESGGSGGNGLPAYMPYEGAKPDLPGKPDGTEPGFLKQPAQLVPAVSSAPGDGSTVTGFALNYGQIAPQADSNPFWRQLNKNLGVTLKMNVVPSGQYQDKFNVMVAGGGLPDLVQIRHYPDLAQMLAAKFTDLSPHLAGDAVKDYPLLANIPNTCWEQCVFDGKIYGVPVARGVVGPVMFRHDDMFAKKGVDPDFSSFDDFKAACKELTDVKNNVWAVDAPGPTFNFIAQMIGVPNRWSVKDGKFSFWIEDPRFKEALSAAAALNKAGYVHPDSAGGNTAHFKTWFKGGHVAMMWDGFTAWPNYFQDTTGASPEKINACVPPPYDSGSKPNGWQSSPIFSFTGLKKADDKRVTMLLRVLDYLAAPTGTKEKFFLTYGIKGTDYTMVDGVPTLTDEEKSSQSIGGISFQYMCTAPPVLTGDSALVQAEYDFQTKWIPTSVPDPSLSLYSDTWVNKSGALNKAVTSAIGDVVLGRKPASDWDSAIKAFKDGGGAKAAEEYEKAYAAK